MRGKIVLAGVLMCSAAAVSASAQQTKKVTAGPEYAAPATLRRWFGEGLIGWAREILLDSRTRQRGWTDDREVARLLQQHEIGTRDHAKRIWALVSLVFGPGASGFPGLLSTKSVFPNMRSSVGKFMTKSTRTELHIPFVIARRCQGLPA